MKMNYLTLVLFLALIREQILALSSMDFEKLALEAEEEMDRFLTNCIELGVADAKSHHKELINCQKQLIKTEGLEGMAENPHQWFKENCPNVRSGNLSACWNVFLEQIDTCLESTSRTSVHNLLAFSWSLDNYICQDDGHKMLVLFSDPNNSKCFASSLSKITSNECRLDADRLKLNHFTMFTDDKCESIVSYYDCFVRAFDDYCPANPLIGYLTRGVKTGLKATSCNSYSSPSFSQNPVAEHYVKSAATGPPEHYFKSGAAGPISFGFFVYFIICLTARYFL